MIATAYVHHRVSTAAIRKENTVEGYIVQFTKLGFLYPTEIYYYHSFKDAEYHFNLFLQDTSNLYSKIELIRLDAARSVLKHIDFPIDEQKHI